MYQASPFKLFKHPSTNITDRENSGNLGLSYMVDHHYNSYLDFGIFQIYNYNIDFIRTNIYFT